MTNINYLVLMQKRTASDYNDFIGMLYHFPQKYYKLLSSGSVRFIYYDPDAKVYFGTGEISSIFEDKREENCYFAKVCNYKPFSNVVSFKDKNDTPRESGPTYNAQNAVRRISQKTLEDISLDGGIVLNIESDVHLIKVLGEQLIGSEKVGVLELIKNSIDAGASYCRVRIENIPNLPELFSAQDKEYPNLPGPVIIIEDDGCGMSKDGVENGWLRPASTLKTNIKEQIRKEREKAEQSGNLGTYDALLKELTKARGRIPLGEKGVGRFAAHRLGRYLELRTKTKGMPYELVLKIDWNDFDKITGEHVNLNSIGVSLFKEPLSRDYGTTDSGTKLIIYGGKKGFSWGEKELQELNISILKLNSPNPVPYKGIKPSLSFHASLECPQIQEDLPTTLISSETKANFVFDILINEQGVAESYELKFKHPHDFIPPETIKGKNVDLRIIDNNDANYWFVGEHKRKAECGGFYMHLDIWYRTAAWIDLPEYKVLTDYLDDYGGVSVYRDGVLIFDSKLSSEYDWLGLGRKHIKQGFRLSYRDFIGNIELNQIDNFNLIDKTNREGLLENQAASDLAKLAASAIESIVLPVYIRKRDEMTKLTKGLVTEPAKLNKIAKASSSFFTNVLNSDYPLETDPYQFFSNLWDKVEERRSGIINLEASMKQLQKNIKILEDTQSLFIEQAGFGIAVAISLHEINKITSHFYEGVSGLLKSGDFNRIKLEDLKATSQSLRSELKRLSPLRSIRNEKNMEFDVIKSIKYALEVYRLRMEKEKIKCEIINPEDSFVVYGKYSTLNQVFGNLLDNSIYWIKYAAKECKQIKVLFDKKYRTVVFADSGSDISEVIRPSLFQPGYSLKTPPSGLGLFISKTYLNNMKASIYETPFKDRIASMEGAQFTLDFKKTPERGVR